MTMDLNHRRKDPVTDVHINVTGDDHTELTPPTKPSNKRSFDVAFLMLPDDKLKQKQLKASKQAFITYSQQIPVQDSKITFNNNEKPEDYEPVHGIRKDSPLVDDAVRCSDENKVINHSRIIHNTLQKTQIFDDPNLGKQKLNYEVEIENYRTKVNLNSSPEQKSAFTKVNMKDARLSPNLSISPDLSYQNSLSPSPPIINRQYQNFPPNILSPNQIFKSQNVPAYQNNFMQENINNFSSSPSTSIENPFLKASPNPELLQPHFAKMRPILQYRPELPYLGGNTYPATFQPQDMLKIAPPDIRNPAAAILTSLLPPSFAALSLPAQNVCAKCNISFRMTSDLVYHMRSHHKNDVANDLSKRRREEKLKCPVCSESFRERHHLTRHMTAHQDKEGDSIEPDNKKKNAFVNFSNK